MSLSLFNRNSIKIVMIYLVLFSTIPMFGQTTPDNSDFLVAASGLGLAVGIELFAKDHFMPDQPRFSKPNSMDAEIRKQLYWGKQKQEIARIWSDRLIYGVSFSSLAWGPGFSSNPELSALINMEVFALNSIVTNIIKVGFARERPYHHYETRPARGAVDFASFFSGHSSVAFSQAVSNAIILSEDYPHHSVAIWSSLLSLASATAYFRVAGDMHYFSDVVVGAGVGIMIAWFITDYELDRFNKDSQPGVNFRLNLKIPLG